MNFTLQSNLHAAVIMDGNGRWANSKLLPRAAGHRAGAESLRKIVEAAPGLGVSILTAYAFSSDNWKRPEPEVRTLMTLLGWYLANETQRCIENGVRMCVIGRRDRLDDTLRNAISAAETATEAGTRMQLRLAIDYSAREAILRAVETANGIPANFETGLTDVPTVDLLIRTGGEQRLSDFLLWECAYAELFFTPVMWPDFTPGHLRRILHEFKRRDRRFGGLAPSVDGHLAGATATAGPPPLRERWLS